MELVEFISVEFRGELSAGYKKSSDHTYITFRVKKLSMNGKMKSTRIGTRSNPTPINWKNEGKPAQAVEKQ